MEIYLKDKKIKEKNDSDKKIELILSVIETKRELEMANKNFETAEQGLIDYYIYQIKACKLKLGFLMEKAKNTGISLNMLEQMNLIKNKEYS